jgi:Peptidase A4 family
MKVSTRAGTIALMAGVMALAAAPIASASSHAPSPTASAARCHGNPVKVFTLSRGLRPLDASASELHASGLPARPTNPGALRDWKLAMSRLKRLTAPHPVCGTGMRALEYVYNGFLAGDAAPASANGLSSITGSYSMWTQPKVGNNSKYTNYNDAPDASMWTGIGDPYGQSDVIQAGCDSISTSTAVYKCWTENAPYESPIWEGPSVAPGQLMYVSVSYLGGDDTEFYIENTTTGDGQTFVNHTPDVNLGAADFMLERADGLYLPNFGTITQQDNGFTGPSGGGVLVSGKNDVLRISSNCGTSGTILANPGPVSDNAFTQNTSASSPYCNTLGDYTIVPGP